MEYIHIIKEQLPYKFNIQLERETFSMVVLYNEEFDYFTVDLYKEGEVIVYGDRIVYGKPLFSSYDYINKPKVNIVPYDIARKESEVTYENLGESVFLYLDREGDLVETI